MRCSLRCLRAWVGWCGCHSPNIGQQQELWMMALKWPVVQVREGSAIYKFADGSVEVCNGWVLDFDWRFDPMTFLWLRVWLQVGNKMYSCWNQVSLYKGGEQTGPAKFTWPNGAVREGSKVGFWSWTFIACQHTCQSSKSFKLLVPAIVTLVASSGERSLGRWMLLHLQWGTKGWKTRRWEVRIQFQLFDLGKILVF